MTQEILDLSLLPFQVPTVTVLANKWFLRNKATEKLNRQIVNKASDTLNLSLVKSYYRTWNIWKISPSGTFQCCKALQNNEKENMKKTKIKNLRIFIHAIYKNCPFINYKKIVKNLLIFFQQNHSFCEYFTKKITYKATYLVLCIQSHCSFYDQHQPSRIKMLQS